MKKSEIKIGDKIVRESNPSNYTGAVWTVSEIKEDYIRVKKVISGGLQTRLVDKKMFKMWRVVKDDQ